MHILVEISHGFDLKDGRLLACVRLWRVLLRQGRAWRRRSVVNDDVFLDRVVRLIVILRPGSCVIVSPLGFFLLELAGLRKGAVRAREPHRSMLEIFRLCVRKVPYHLALLILRLVSFTFYC